MIIGGCLLRIQSNFCRGLEMEIRRFKQEDATELSNVISETIKISNSKDYPPKYVEVNLLSHSPEALIERAKNSHMYVVCDNLKIIGCGAIAEFWGSNTESILLTIFVLPDYQGKGVGRKIIETLEKDEYFTRANRIEIPASITAVEFYKKMGYDYKNGIEELENGVLYRLEKFR